ncbi:MULTISPECIES: cytochrome-c oxidase, cbb3-type subunit II [unclassified Shewanella]|uniref:cytochrome-c oxidase, cbb3-type subunit II n=1 Tax=unclassified Shewanella TaxID=196818 RepID=UPI001BC0334A|nr:MULTISPECIES: cytochrome-c oxidase, cbb3-type subunit II [unclassified Shewanella]GIU10865.1 peptidase S41 [Shewanella sp. MBTL60-112-B1]GIU33000.1 peptidase S41 [Shewanella sp. MBTL60-112-B2]
MKFNHEIVEKNIGLLGILTVVAISFGSLVEITPLLFQEDTTEPLEGQIPYTAMQIEGRDIYVREGCYGCHSQMIRPLRAETERYGHYSVAGESVWDHPFQWGSKRTGPDLARVGGRYSDKWHEVHLIDPRAVVPQSNMPAYPWLAENILTGDLTGQKMQILQNLHPTHQMYTTEEIDGAKDAVKGKTELDALIAYLQSLGHALK